MGMKVNGSSGLVFPDSTTMTTGSQAVRAWVNFNGTGTVAIRASYNVSSITDGGTGIYTVNFTTAMTDANYSCGGLNAFPASVYQLYFISGTASGVTVATYNGLSSPLADSPNVFVQIFR